MHAGHAAVSSVLLVLLLALSILTLLPHTPASPRSFFRPRPRLIDGSSTKVHPEAVDGAGCDYSNGAWVRDADPTAVYKEDCPFLDPGFQCTRNGRTDSSFRHWRWHPRGSCTLPKFNASEMLERSRNGRIVFAGDSIGRNQWESMVCMLASAVPPGDGSRIYERSGKPISRHKGYLSMFFADYNLSVEYYRAPMLVVIDRFAQPASKINGAAVRGAIRLDALPRHAERWATADVLVLNTGHWWNQHKTIKAGNYFMVGKRLNVTTDIKEAFRLSLQTVTDWELSTTRHSKSYFFFRSYSPSHYRNGTWDTGGSCADQQEPLTTTGGDQWSEEYEYSWMNAMISSATRGLRRKGRNARFLNITYMTELRRDGHPSRHREPGTPPDAPEDCSHWCLPGVPDAWNQALYAHLLALRRKTRSPSPRWDRSHSPIPRKRRSSPSPRRQRRRRSRSSTSSLINNSRSPSHGSEQNNLIGKQRKEEEEKKRRQKEAELKLLEEELARRVEEEIRKNVEEHLNSEEVKNEIKRRVEDGIKKLFDEVDAQLLKEKESALKEARQKVEQERREREELDRMLEENRRKVEESQRKEAQEQQQKELERYLELERIQKQREEALRRKKIEEEEERVRQMKLLGRNRY